VKRVEGDSNSLLRNLHILLENKANMTQRGIQILRTKATPDNCVFTYATYYFVLGHIIADAEPVSSAE
jgi:hypothetical protein